MKSQGMYRALAFGLLLLLVAIPVIFVSPAEANRQDKLITTPDGKVRPPEIDVRSGSQGVAKGLMSLRSPAPTQLKSLNALQATARVPLQVQYNVLTATPRHLFSHAGYLTPPSADDPEKIARNFLNRWKSIFRFSDADLENLQVKSRSHLPDLGTTVLVFKQQQKGVPYYHGEVLVNVNREGKIMSVGSESFPELTITNAVSISPADAIAAATKEFGLDGFDGKPLGSTEVLATYGDLKPEYIEGQKFNGGGLYTDDIIVTRTIFPMGDTGREAYKFNLTTPQFEGIVWEHIVDAQTGELLRRFSLTMFQRRAARRGPRTQDEAPRPVVKSNNFGVRFGDPGGGAINSRRAIFRPDIQDMVEGYNAAGTATGKVFDSMPTALSGRRCTNAADPNCGSTAAKGYGRSPARGTPPTYAPETETNRNNGRGFKRSLVKARIQTPYAETGTPLFSAVYNTPFAQVLRGFPDALNPSAGSPFGWFYLPTNAGGTEIISGDTNRAATKEFGYTMATEAKARNVPENSPPGACTGSPPSQNCDQPFSATLTSIPSVTLPDGRTLTQVFQSNYTEGNNVLTSDDRANDNETTNGIRGFDPNRQFTATRFDFINSYEYGNQEPVATGPGGGPCPPLLACSVAFPATANPDIYPGTLTLFYYNNIVHDYLYSIGFTEALFNMQQDNFGRGGAGRDAVITQVQDGSGTNNANMSPAADGSKPRMQMFLFTEASFRRADGDFDFDVVTHEQMHAINNRAVGKGDTGCVGNGLVGESGGQGEGWGDYLADSMADDDAIGEYVTGEFDVAIRRLPLTNYRWSYASINGNGLTRRDQQPPDSDPGATPFETHDTGEVWSATLWDMRELLIMKDPNGVFFDGARRLDANQASGSGTQFYIGYRQVRSKDNRHPIDYREEFNTNDPATIKPTEHIVRPGQVAAQANRNGPLATAVRNGGRLADLLMLRGMQLSPCNPTFVDSRNSILAADTELTGGENRAIIWRAFASHGVGTLATSSSNGGAGGTVVEDFSVPAGVTACEQSGPLPAPPFSLSNATPNAVVITINGGTPVQGAARYIISRANNSNGPFIAIADIPASQTTYTDNNGGEGLSGGLTLYYQVRASRDNEKDCVSTSITQPITVAGPPITPAPVFLGVDQVLDPQACSRLVVSWNPAVSLNPNAQIVYNVYRAETAADADPAIPGSNATTEPTFTPTDQNRIATEISGTSFIDTGLKLNRVYYYIVQAKDKNNNKIDTNNTGNRRAKFNAPTTSAVTNTPVFPIENFESTSADTRFQPPLVEAGNDPQGQTPNFQRVTGVQIAPNAFSSTMYAPDYNPSEGAPGQQCGSTGGGQSDFSTTIGPLQLTPNSIMEWDQLFVTEANFDGGLVEIKVGGDATFNSQPYPDNITTFDLGRFMVQGGYNGRLDANGDPTNQTNVTTLNRRAFTGSKPLHHVRIPLEAFAPGGTHNPQGLPVRIRFRMTSDVLSIPSCNAGWFIDNLVINNLDENTCPSLLLPQPGDVVINEFRFRGPNGAEDEFIELHNNTLRPLIVGAGDTSAGAGWSLVGSDGVVRATIPKETLIPARGFYLLVNSDGYSLSAYPSGDPAPGATGDLSYTEDIPDTGGVALYRTINPAGFSAATALDAVGFTGTAAPYSEGTPLPAIGSDNGEYAHVRKVPIVAPGRSQDTNNNAADFFFISTTAGSFNGVQSMLGAPGPQNLASPTQRNVRMPVSLVDPLGGIGAAPNRERSTIPVINGRFGQLRIRRAYRNLTGQPITRLRFRIVEITTLQSPGYVDCNAPGGPNPCPQADIRAINSEDVIVRRADNSQVTVRGTTVEEPPEQNPPPIGSGLGGGHNSSWTVTLAAPIGHGESINVQFVVGIEQVGNFRVLVNVEGLNPPGISSAEATR